MSSCEGRLEALSALLDGELAPEEELELRRHVDTCEACQAWRTQLGGLSTAVARSIGRERAPRQLALRVRRLETVSWRGRAAAAASAAAGVLVAALVWFGQTAPRDGSAALLIEDHHRLVSGASALAIPSSDPGAVSRGLAAKLPFRVAVSDVEGARLRGGHDCSLPEGRAAYLQYEREGERISVFVAPHLAPGPGSEPCRTVSGETLCTFEGEGQMVAVVARRPETAQAFQRAASIVGSR
jgi:anti-sigma factor RsiW